MIKTAFLALAFASASFSALAQSAFSPTADEFAKMIGTKRKKEAQQLQMHTTSVHSPDHTIVENLDQQEDYTLFIQSLERAAMVPLLQSAGPYTVLVPTNKAFQRLVSSGALADLWLPANQQELYKLLAGHIVVGDLRVQNLTEGRHLTTLAGTRLQVVRRNGRLHFVDAQGHSAAVITTDLVSRNGVVHTLNEVFGK